MEAQYAQTKEELLLEVKAKTTTRGVKDFAPAGIRTESNYEGECKGRYNARSVATITGLIKPDGTTEYEGREIDTTNDGEIILLTHKGKGTPLNPPVGKIEGETTFQTPSKKLAWLNGMKARHEGTFNSANGEVSAKVYGKT